MTTNFPGALDSLPNPTPTDTVAEVSHADQHANANDAIEALQEKVGADNSEMESSHDFKLGGVADGDKASSLSGEEDLENKTLLEPVIEDPAIDGGDHNDGSFENPHLHGNIDVQMGGDAEGDLYYRDADGKLQRLPAGGEGETLVIEDGIPHWSEPSTTASDFFQGNMTNLNGTANPWTVAGTHTKTAGFTYGSGVITVGREGVCTVDLRAWADNSRDFNLSVSLEINGSVPSDFQAVSIYESHGSYPQSKAGGFIYRFNASPGDTIEITVGGTFSTDTLKGIVSCQLI